MPKSKPSAKSETTAPAILDQVAAPDAELLWLERRIAAAHRIANECFLGRRPGLEEEGEPMVRDADRMMGRMFATHATTNAGRAAKARVWLRHGTSEAWRDDLKNGDLEQIQLVEVLADLCGMSPLSLAHGYTDAHIAERN